MQRELGCHMQGPGFPAHLSYTRKRRAVKQSDASFKDLPRLGLFKKSDSGGNKEKAALASLCFTLHSQLIPFTHPKLCLHQCNHSGGFQHAGIHWGPWAAGLYLSLVSLGHSEELPGALWSSGNSMVHVHSKTSSCCSPAQSSLPQPMWYWDTISWATSCGFDRKRKNSHSECKKWPSSFIPGLKCFPTTMRSGSLRLPIL